MSNSFTNFNGTGKEMMRKIAVEKCGKSDVKVALFLPGEHQKCLIEAIDSGRVRKDTWIIAIERNEGTALKIEKFLKKKGFCNFYIHRDDAHTLDLVDLVGGNDLDFAYLDFCGQITATLADWLMQQFFPSCKPGIEVSFTFSTNIRNNNLYKFLNEHFWGMVSGFDIVRKESVPYLRNAKLHLRSYVNDSGETETDINASNVQALLTAVLPIKARIEQAWSYGDSKTQMYFAVVKLPDSDWFKCSDCDPLHQAIYELCGGGLYDRTYWRNEWVVGMTG